MGGGILVVFVLCGDGFCVDSGGFSVGGGGFSDIKFVWKLKKWLRKIAFSECYQTLKIVFRTIFHCTPKCSDFSFFMRIHFLLHSFYTRNSIYFEPNTALKSLSLVPIS